MSDSCHIPSDKEVRYAWSEVKLQEQSGFWSAAQKMERGGRNRKTAVPTIVEKVNKGFKKKDKHLQ